MSCYKYQIENRLRKRDRRDRTYPFGTLEVFVEAELPGQDLKDLEIYVTAGNQLTIKGERKQCSADKGVWHRQERTFGHFTRTLTLPFPVNADNVDARLENGLLKVKLAKHESARPRKIEVKA